MVLHIKVIGVELGVQYSKSKASDPGYEWKADLVAFAESESMLPPYLHRLLYMRVVPSEDDTAARQPHMSGHALIFVGSHLVHDLLGILSAIPGTDLRLFVQTVPLWVFEESDLVLLQSMLSKRDYRFDRGMVAVHPDTDIVPWHEFVREELVLFGSEIGTAYAAVGVDNSIGIRLDSIVVGEADVVHSLFDGDRF